MSDTAILADCQEIVVDEVFPHRPELVWKILTTPELMGRWLGMTPSGFEAVTGRRFTYQTTAAGSWDGVIHCQVLEVIPYERLVYEWRGGDDANVGYGSRLDTLVHSGFVTPRNDSALENMSKGWPKVIGRIDDIAREFDA
jgi:uncharacterized protein YndB with AHSA1/START domain